MLGFSLAPQAHAAVNLVQNGAFEQTLLTSPGGYICQKASTCVSNITSWSSTCQGTTCGTSGTVASLLFANTNGSAFNGGIGLAGTIANSPNGGNYVAIDGDPTYSASISQNISGLTVGQLYKLQFYQAAAQQKGTTGNQTEYWKVTFGAEMLTSTVMNNPTGGFQAWNLQTMYFTPTSVVQALTFLAMGTPNGGPPVVLLDGVSLVTPEPATFVMLGSALAGLVALRKRKSI